MGTTVAELESERLKFEVRIREGNRMQVRQDYGREAFGNDLVALRIWAGFLPNVAHRSRIAETCSRCRASSCQPPSHSTGHCRSDGLPGDCGTHRTPSIRTISRLLADETRPSSRADRPHPPLVSRSRGYLVPLNRAQCPRRVLAGRLGDATGYFGSRIDHAGHPRQRFGDVAQPLPLFPVHP